MRNLAREVFVSNVLMAATAIIIFAVGLITLEYYRLEDSIAEARGLMLENQRKTLKIEVQRVADYIEFLRSSSLLSSNGTENLQKTVLKWIGSIRFGKHGYIFVHGFDGVVLSDAEQGLVGRNASGFEDIHGQNFIRELTRIAREPGGGFLTYYGPFKPDSGKSSRIMSYARSDAKWHWVIGAGEYLDDIENEAAKLSGGFWTHSRQRLTEGIFLLLVLIFLAWMYSERVKNRIKANFKVYFDFFERSIRELKPMDPRSLYYDEFKTLAISANEMVSRRLVLEEENRNLEKKLRLSMKMELIGRVAGGVAHDLNNILGGIINFPELILLQLPNNSPVRADVEAIREAGARASTVVRDLLSMTRSGMAVRKPVDLNALILSFVSSPELLERKRLIPGVDFCLDLMERPAMTQGAKVHLTRVIANLFFFALSACETAAEHPDEDEQHAPKTSDGSPDSIAANSEGSHDGPRQIVISTSEAFFSAPACRFEIINPGAYFAITVSNPFQVIADEHLQRIFEPFYATKVMGWSGSGLALPVVWGIVKDHDGFIDITSSADHGTSIKVFFPACLETDRNMAESEVGDDIKASGERILVVDDDVEQRGIAVRFLADLGYRAESVPTGEKALELIETNEYDLLVIDMILGTGIDGLETFSRAMSLRPGIRAIIVSGFSESDRVREAMRIGVRAFVQKPYFLRQLGRVVKNSLSLNIVSEH